MFHRIELDGRKNPSSLPAYDSVPAASNFQPEQGAEKLEKQVPRLGLKSSLGMTQIMGLSARLKPCPDTKHVQLKLRPFKAHCN